MLFFLHVLGLLWGFFGLVWCKLVGTPGELVLPNQPLAVIAKLYPPSAFSPQWQDLEGNDLQEPNISKPLMITGGVFAYCLFYLFNNRRP